MTVILEHDQTLVQQTLKGEKNAFKRLIERYSKLIYNHIYRMSGSWEMADELTQEVFVKVYQKLDTFDSTKPFKPWLMRIASNTTLSEFRKRSKVVSLDALKENGYWKEPNSAPDTSALVETRLSTQAVLMLMQSLEAKYREVLLLRYKEELSYEEIADAMNTPVNTVRTWLKRGRDRLKKEMAKQNKRIVSP